MYRTRLGMAAAIALGCLAVGCAKKSTSDQALTTDIQSKLYADDATKAAGIKVDVKNGAVTLSGDVPSSDVELEAMKVANGTAGVATVNDQMKVNAAAAANNPGPPPTSPPPPSPEPAAQSAPPPATPPADTASAPPAVEAREAEPVTIPAGTRLQVRTVDAIDSKVNTPGQTFQASLDAPLVHGNRVIAPAGSPVTIVLTNAANAGRIKGRSELSVRVSAIGVRGRTYEVSSSVYDQAGGSRGKQSAIRTGIGAAAGALIGGLAGGGKGAAIGSAAGGGAGIGFQAFTHGAQVKIPSETVLTFRLEAPLRVRR